MVQDYGKRSADICLGMQAVGTWCNLSLYVNTAISMVEADEAISLNYLSLLEAFKKRMNS